MTSTYDNVVSCCCRSRSRLMECPLDDGQTNFFSRLLFNLTIDEYSLLVHRVISLEQLWWPTILPEQHSHVGAVGSSHIIILHDNDGNNNASNNSANNVSAFCRNEGDANFYQLIQYCCDCVKSSLQLITCKCRRRQTHGSRREKGEVEF